MQDETELWNFIHAAEYKVPLPPVSEAAQSGIQRLWMSLQRTFQQPKRNAASEEPQWDRPSSERLKSILPDPDWNQAAIQLARALGDAWFEQPEPARPIRCFIGAPGVNIATVLQSLVQQRRLCELSAPSHELLLDASRSNSSLLQALNEAADHVLVIPQLERWYLRHEEGLSVIRDLIESLIRMRRRVLIGCGSWAWAFLQQAIGIEDELGGPQTLAPLDAQRLDAWFRATFDLNTYEFRQSGSEKPVFAELAAADEEKIKQKQAETSKLMSSLAAKSRGNPGVALALWRACLRTRDTDSKRPAILASTATTVLWVVSPSELQAPQLDIDVDRVHRFVLHWILLHGGLSLALLIRLLPFSADQIRRRVNTLREAGVLEEQDERLQVALTAYPLVRRDLESEGFLTDAF